MIFFEQIGRIITKIVLVCLVFALSFLTYCYFSIYVLGNDYVNVLGYTFFEVGSGSMSPTILSKDAIIVKIHDDYKTNDIITFYYQDNVVTHRVIKILEHKIITKGDANNVNDLSIDPRDVIGKVVFVWKSAAIWKKVLLNPRVVVLVIITLLLFIVTLSYDSRLYKKFRMRRLSKKKIKEVKKEVRERNKKEREKKKNKKSASRSKGEKL